MEYGAPNWNPHSTKLIAMIENVQRMASRQIPGLSHLTYQERLEAMEFPTLQYRRYKGDMIEMYKPSYDMYNKETHLQTYTNIYRCITKKPISYFLYFRHNHTREHNFRGHQFNHTRNRVKRMSEHTLPSVGSQINGIHTFQPSRFRRDNLAFGRFVQLSRFQHICPARAHTTRKC